MYFICEVEIVFLSLKFQNVKKNYGRFFYIKILKFDIKEG